MFSAQNLPWAVGIGPYDSEAGQDDAGRGGTTATRLSDGGCANYVAVSPELSGHHVVHSENPKEPQNML